MHILSRAAFAALALSLLHSAAVQAGGKWAVGVSIGGPVYAPPPPWHYHPYPIYRPYYPYYRPYPVVVEQPVVVVEPARVVAPPVAYPAYRPTETAPPPRSVEPPPVPQPEIQPAANVVATRADVDSRLRQLADPDETTRAEAVLYLGRQRVERAVDPLAATLSGDPSPRVRDAAARSLGLIGTPAALLPLQRAMQVDGDAQVRTSAKFSVDIIQATQRR